MCCATAGVALGRGIRGTETGLCGVAGLLRTFHVIRLFSFTSPDAVSVTTDRGDFSYLVTVTPLLEVWDPNTIT